MGPQPEGRGEPWPSTRPLHVGRGHASMGPQPEGRGEPAVAGSLDRRRQHELQWGHSPKAVENQTPGLPMFTPSVQLQWGHSPKAVENHTGRRVPRARRHTASMGPQPEGRGERDNPMMVNKIPGVASMGPQPEGRGELGDGRAAVGKRFRASMGPQPEGRGERVWASCHHRATISFNGATARRPWRTTAAPLSLFRTQ